MNELTPQSYGIFADEARKIEQVNPGIANHDIKTAVGVVQSGIEDYDPFLTNNQFNDMLRNLEISLTSPSDVLEATIQRKIDGIQQIIIEIQDKLRGSYQNPDFMLGIPKQVQFALNPEHHRFLYYLHNLWKEPNNIHTIESLRRCRVDLPLLLETFGVLPDDSCAGVEVSGVIGGIALSSTRNAVKYAEKDTIPIASFTENDEEKCILSIYNLSGVQHALPDEPYPHLRPIALGERGAAAGNTLIPGTGTGAWAMKVLGLLHDAQYHIWEMADKNEEGQFSYQTTIQFPSFARFTN